MKAWPVLITQSAKADLEAIAFRIAEQSPAHALRFVDELEQACLGLGDMPERFALVPRYEQAGIRRRVHGNYLIFYRITPDAVQVFHILHGAMDYEALLFPES